MMISIYFDYTGADGYCAVDRATKGVRRATDQVGLQCDAHAHVYNL